MTQEQRAALEAARRDMSLVRAQLAPGGFPSKRMNEDTIAFTLSYAKRAIAEIEKALDVSA